MSPCTLPSDTIVDLESLVKHLSLPASDLLLIGDGSGTTYDQAAAWSCVAYDRRQQQVTLHTGGLSTGTNNLVELLPFIQALWHHHQSHGQLPPLPVSVQIISDS